MDSRINRTACNPGSHNRGNWTFRLQVLISTRSALCMAAKGPVDFRLRMEFTQRITHASGRIFCSAK